MTRSVPFAALSLSERFSWVVERLRQALAERAPKDPVLGPLSALLWNRLVWMTRRFVSIAARVRAGRSVRAAARTPRASGADRARPSPERGASCARWPREFGWLLRSVPGTGYLSERLEQMLADPEMAEVLAASAQARRILRSLFRMLAVVPGPELALPRRVRRPKPKREAKPADPTSPIAPSRSGVRRERVPRTPGLGWLRWRPANGSG